MADGGGLTRRLGDAMWGSVRARITLTATLVVAVTLVVAAWALMAAVRHNLVASQDELSKARAIELAQAAQNGHLPHVVTDVGDNGLAQVVDGSGRVLAASSGLRGDGPIAVGPPVGADPVFTVMDAVPDDDETERYRVWAVTVRHDGGTVSVFAGSSPESVSEAVATVRHALWVGIPVIVVLFALATRLLVGRALAPVERLRFEVAALSSGAMSQRVSEPSGRDEIALLAHTMNDLLGRLEASSRRERQFVADASHELQSPLAAFRTQLEVAARSDSVDWPTLARDLLADADRLEGLTRDLLLLAKLDAAGSAPTDLVDLDALVAEEAARARETTTKALDTTRVAAGPVRGDRGDLQRLVRNLLDNALRHARSTVVVSVVADERTVELCVADDGPGIAADDRRRVFERFVRLDPDRRRGSGGSGLGLAIAQGVAERHGGSIEIVDAPRAGIAGTPFVVRLPLG